MQPLVEEILASAKAGKASVLVSIVAHSGSTPRGAGAKMLVLEEGDCFGTIGGGAIEFEAQNTARQVLQTKQHCMRTFHLSQNDVAKLGMVCGGQATVYLQYISPADTACVKAYEKALHCLSSREAFVLLTEIETGNVFVLTPKEDEQAPVLYAEITDVCTHLLADGRYLADPFCSSSRALIFGMGHVGAEVVPVLQHLGFYTVAADDRPEFLTKERLPLADERKVVDFEDALAQFEVEETDYIVILTRGHMHDYSVLRRALQTQACYIGVIGSRGKVALSLQKLREEGVSEENIARIHAPIGLPLGGRTPEEIAISIAAEMIRVRAGYQEPSRKTEGNE